MRTHGWSGAAPASDAEAIERILTAAKEAIIKRGSRIRIADIARELGVTRQTIYRYFPSTDALLVATSISEAAPYLDTLTDHLADEGFGDAQRVGGGGIGAHPGAQGRGDVGWIHPGVDVGTAKLPEGERRGIPHHLLDLLEDVRTEQHRAALGTHPAQQPPHRRPVPTHQLAILPPTAGRRLGGQLHIVEVA